MVRSTGRIATKATSFGCGLAIAELELLRVATVVALLVRHDDIEVPIAGRQLREIQNPNATLAKAIRFVRVLLRTRIAAPYAHPFTKTNFGGELRPWRQATHVETDGKASTSALIGN